MRRFETLPNYFFSVFVAAFSECSSLVYSKYDKGLYLGNSSNPYHALIKGKYESITSCIIHNTTVIVANGAFKNYSSFTSITIPDSVTSIGGSAFV